MQKMTELKKLNTAFRKNRWLAVILIALISAMIVAYIYNIRRVNQSVSQVRRLSSELTELREENRILRSKTKNLSSAERIIPLVEEKFGMKLPENPPTLIENNKND